MFRAGRGGSGSPIGILELSFTPSLLPHAGRCRSPGPAPGPALSPCGSVRGGQGGAGGAGPRQKGRCDSFKEPESLLRSSVPRCQRPAGIPPQLLHRPSGPCWDGERRKDGRRLFATPPRPGKHPQPSHPPLFTPERDSGPFRPSRPALGFGVPRCHRGSGPKNLPTAPPRPPEGLGQQLELLAQVSRSRGSRSRPAEPGKGDPEGASQSILWFRDHPGERGTPVTPALPRPVHVSSAVGRGQAWAGRWREAEDARGCSRWHRRMLRARLATLPSPAAPLAVGTLPAPKTSAAKAFFGGVLTALRALPAPPQPGWALPLLGRCREGWGWPRAVPQPSLGSSRLPPPRLMAKRCQPAVASLGSLLGPAQAGALPLHQSGARHRSTGSRRNFHFVTKVKGIKRR